MISPIPSLLVLIPAGAIVEARHIPPSYVVVLAAICGVARVLGGSILYWLAHRIEHAVFGKRNRKIFGLTHADILRLSKQLGDRKKAWRVWLILFVLHSLPVFPGTLLSAGSGFIKVKYNIFATATFAGSAVNAVIYIWLGYMGLQAAQHLEDIGWLTNIVSIAVVVGLIAWYAVWYSRRRKSRTR
ncbi:MAG TPA: VTT domain-containing protein [Candidatus Saccharimonadales bacterium]|nr:VTT domain-containing protein [Candidatus Saccharimonadales bacterium]